MKTLKLNRNHWIFRLQRYTYGYREDEYELDGCKLGWMLIFLLPMVILTWPVLVFKKFIVDEDSNNVDTALVGGIVLQFLGIVIGMSIITGLWSISDRTALWLLLPSSILGLICVFIFIFLIYLVFKYSSLLITKIKDYRRLKGYKREWKEDKSNFLVEWVKSRKEKSCPMIEWTDE